MKGKKILIGITGSIAAYKTILLIRHFIKVGAEVKVVMTKAAAEFITPLTAATISKNEVVVDLFDDGGNWANHVMLGRWADVFIIAPASCNTIAKMANGLCDNLLLAIYLSATCKVYISPAMDEDMWLHKTTQENLQKLQGHGVELLPVSEGELASGLFGKGRMMEPEDIFNSVSKKLLHEGKLVGKKVLITAGPTIENIDPVRFISNHSSGKMGIAIAEECASQGAAVTLVLGPTKEQPPANVQTIYVQSSNDMYEATMHEFENSHIAILSAAVADYTPVKVAAEKIKKKDEGLEIQLKKTKDILKSLGAIKTPNQTLVGFALETNNEEQNAMGKLEAKNADMIILNSLRDSGAGFGHNTNKITIFDKKGAAIRFGTKSKKEVAKDIVGHIINYINE